MFRIKSIPTLVVAAIGTIATYGYAGSQPQTTRNSLTIEQLIDIRHPSSPVWSPDGQLVAFLWDRAGVSNIYLSHLDGAQPTALTSYSDGSIRRIFFSADGKQLYFARSGDLWKIPIAGGRPTTVWSTPLGDGEFAPSPDRSRVALKRKGGDGQGDDLVIRSLLDSS